ncbi:hypothetical protein RIF29_39331 [Crotalaria pallida]|uniref:Carbonic anhydrase n=1 Tax=Crotalaria pallida TaxID=3830 RepID=A0AAN9E410_CROPI
MMSLLTNFNLFSLVLVVLIFSSSSFLIISASDSEDNVEFTYIEGSGKGPKDWGNLNPKWKVCGDGKLQSPIDLVDERVQVFLQLDKLKRYYKPAPAILKNRGSDIMLKWEGDAGQVVINGTNYNLLQCHWHTPSEHTLNGSKFDLELHVVHQNSKGDIAVIGQWYKIGMPNPLLSKLINTIKSLKNSTVDLGIINPLEIRFGSRRYYRYLGSLTTPSCTEGVIWTIAKKVRTVSMEQVQALKAAVNHGYEENARPTQELNGRQVYFYPGE